MAVKEQREHGPRAQRAAAGFTLIELMVVIIILGMISGIAMVSWQALLPNQKFNTAVRRLSEVLHQTRSDAIARSHEFRIYYNIDEDDYRIRSPFRVGGGLATSEDDEFVWVEDTNLGKEGINILQVTIDDVTYYDGEVYVRFDPLGAASYHTVVLRQDLFDREFTIEAMPLTGDIRFHDGLFQREPAQENDFD
jgi:prepilin-type N-terminal cleavage/methylation domain-containing protein